MSKNKTHLLHRLKSIFFRGCKLASIAGAGTAIVVLLIQAINQTADGAPSAIAAGGISLIAFWMLDREVDKIDNPNC